MFQFNLHNNRILIIFLNFRTVCPLQHLAAYVSSNFVADVFSYIVTNKKPDALVPILWSSAENFSVKSFSSFFWGGGQSLNFSFSKQCILSHFIHNSTARYVSLKTLFPQNLIPWRDSNPGLLVPEADAMSTAPRRQGVKSGQILILSLWTTFFPKVPDKKILCVAQWTIYTRGKNICFTLLSFVFFICFFKDIYFFFFLKSYYPIPWRDSISRPINSILLTASRRRFRYSTPPGQFYR
jgi:hypothetical protein